jgi:hypothetical protein
MKCEQEEKNSAAVTDLGDAKSMARAFTRLRKRRSSGLRPMAEVGLPL